MFSPEFTVLETLGTSSNAASVFTSHRTACVGCYLARFCSLRDVAGTYGLVLDDFLDEMDRTAGIDTYHATGALYDQQT